MERVGGHFVARKGFIRRSKSPTFITHVPMDRSKGDEVLKALQLSYDQGPMGCTLR